MKNTRGVPCGRGQTAPREPSCGLPHHFLRTCLGVYLRGCLHADAGVWAGVVVEGDEVDIFMENDAVYSTWLDRSYSGTRLRFRKLEDGNYELVDDDRKPLADLPVYVNVRNERRYFRSTPIKDALSENRRDWPIHLKISLRKQKALHLYHLIREYKLFDWWD